MTCWDGKDGRDDELATQNKQFAVLKFLETTVSFGFSAFVTWKCNSMRIH